VSKVLLKLTKKLFSTSASRKTATIIAVGGGKGGVGKSFFSANLALALGQYKKSVLIVDLDLGAPNTHTLLGSTMPQKGVTDLLENPQLSINDVLEETPYENISLLGVGRENDDLNEINKESFDALLLKISHHPSDIIILDLGAGTGSAYLKAFTKADYQFVVTTPESSGVENSYSFIRKAFFHVVEEQQDSLGLTKAIKTALRENKNLFPQRLMSLLMEQAPEKTMQLESKLVSLRPLIILNQGRTRNDIDIAKGIESVCQRFLGVNARHFGFIQYDNTVWQSLRRRRPHYLDCPLSLTNGEISEIAKKILSEQSQKLMVG